MLCIWDLYLIRTLGVVRIIESLPGQLSAVGMTEVDKRVDAGFVADSWRHRVENFSKGGEGIYDLRNSTDSFRLVTHVGIA